MHLETSKIRERVLPYCNGYGIDIGCRDDKIIADCVGFDIEDHSGVTLVGDASKRLPFSDEEFDWLYSSHCLEHIEDAYGSLLEWTRVIRQGGKIILYVPHPDLYKEDNPEHKHPGFTAETLGEWLREFGFRIVDTFLDNSPKDHYSLLVVAEKK